MEKLSVTEKEMERVPETLIIPGYEYSERKEYLPLYYAAKRAFDLVCCTFGLLLFSPVIAVIAAAIKIEDGGPVIHKRICVGPDNKKYKMYKFRSMVTDADDVKRWLSPEQVISFYREAKVENDPRITKVGAFLRKTSLDEIPQLVSVLKNDMSIIGPRPFVGSEVNNYTPAQLKQVLSAKPGMTGYWQVNGRGECTYESGERQKLVLYYVQNRSLALDTKILFKTVRVVLCGKGAR